MEEVIRTKHVRYFQGLLASLPAAYASLDTSRMMVVYFCCNALDILGELMPFRGGEPARLKLVQWIYSMQVPGTGGFVGGSFSGEGAGAGGTRMEAESSSAHISMTYTAIATLAMLGDDLKGVDREAIVRLLRSLQNPETGCFRAVPFGSEEDVRFIFCAAAIGFMLQDWRGINVPNAVKFILSTQAFDGGFGLCPGLESHGGSTYCATAALALFGELNFPHKAAMKHFCMSRQIGGFNGRVNKDEDTCYTFWVGGTMQLLGFLEEMDPLAAREFILRCQHQKYGGFSKTPEGLPDVLHAHFSVCGLSLIGELGFGSIDSGLCMTIRAFDFSPFREGKTAKGTLYQHPAVLCGDFFAI